MSHGTLYQNYLDQKEKVEKEFPMNIVVIGGCALCAVVTALIALFSNYLGGFSPTVVCFGTAAVAAVSAAGWLTWDTVTQVKYLTHLELRVDNEL